MVIDNNLLGIIITAVAGLIGIILTGIQNVKLAKINKNLDAELSKQKQDNEQAIIKYDIVTNLLKFSQYQKIYDAVIRMMDTSKVDRFLMFIAVNGKTDLNNVTCIFQKYRGDKAEIDAVAVYKGLKVDTTYVKMLKEMEREGEITIETEKLDPCLIKDIYESENVAWSNWRFIGRINIDERNDVIAFCSAATFDKDKYTQKDMLSIKLNFESVIKPDFMKTVKEMKANHQN